MSNQLKSGICTAVIMALVAVVLLAFGYDPPDPPIPEEGVEVNLGDSDFGLGSDPNPASEASSYAPPAAQNQVATQHTEPSVSMPSTPNPGSVTNPAAQEQPQVENKQPVLNPNATFPGMRNRDRQSGSGSEGQSTGTGDQGKPNGNPNSRNYTGDGGNGSNYRLSGRTAVSLPKPAYNSNQQGKIVIDIWVNQQGQVVRVEGPAQGSTITNSGMVEQAKQAARKARFNADTKALEEQKGSITYIFTI